MVATKFVVVALVAVRPTMLAIDALKVLAIADVKSAREAKRLVLNAVVLKRFVVVALARVTVPRFAFVEKRFVEVALPRIVFVPVAFSHARSVVEAMAAERLETYSFVVVAFVATRLVAVRLVIVAMVAVNAFTMPVVKVPSTENRFVEVAAEKDAFVAIIPVEDAELNETAPAARFPPTLRSPERDVSPDTEREFASIDAPEREAFAIVPPEIVGAVMFVLVSWSIALAAAMVLEPPPPSGGEASALNVFAAMFNSTADWSAASF